MTLVMVDRVLAYQNKGHLIKVFRADHVGIGMTCKNEFDLHTMGPIGDIVSLRG